MKAVQGNWRNAVYLYCGCTPCPYRNRQSCEGFLLAFDSDAAPILLSIELFQRCTGETVDPTACSSSWRLEFFAATFRLYLLWNTTGGNQCPAWELSQQHEK